MRLPRKKLSRKLKRAIRSSNEDLYRIAIEAGMHPSTLSRFLNDARGVKAVSYTHLTLPTKA